MKNCILLLLLGFSINLSAQNVGIGTNSPDASAKLDIVDSNRGLLIPRVSLTATNASGPVTSPATSLLVYNTATSGTAPNNVWPGYYYWDGMQWVRLMDNDASDWKLDGNTNGVLRYIGTNDNFDFPIRTNGTERMRVTTAGSVGIGTTAPTQRLHVSGGSVLTDRAYAATTLDLAAGGTIDITLPATQVRITNVAGNQANAVTYSATAIEGQYLWISNTDNDAATFAGATIPSNTAMGFVYTGGAWRPVRALGAGDDWKLDGNNNGVLRYIGTNDNFDFPIRTNGTERMRVTTAGNVGIATTTPPSRLTIANNIATGPLDNFSEYQILLWQNTAAVNSYGLGIRGGTMVFNSNANYHFDEDGVTRVTFASGGNVGIGTTNPLGNGSDLHLGGDGEVALSFGTHATAGNNFHFVLNDHGGVRGLRYYSGNYGSGTHIMTILNNSGNVGIGTTTPPSKLTIANNVATGPLDNFSEYQILLWQNTTAVNSYGLGIRGGTMVFNTDGSFQFDEDGNTRVTFASGGNVGIGTTNPLGNGSDLHLGGDSEVALSFGTHATAGNNSHFVLNDHSGVRGLRYYSGNYGSGNHIMTILNSGNVGIGTATPLGRLHVFGDAVIGNNNTDGPRLVWRGGSGGNQEYRARVFTDGRLTFFPAEIGNPNFVGEVLVLTQNGRVGVGQVNPGGLFELNLDQGRKPGTNTWTVVSDERLKNIHGLYQKGLKEVLQLQPITYHYKNVGNRVFPEQVLNTLNVSFSAQEVQKIFPECVGTDEDGYLNFNMHAILVAYSNAIKELHQSNNKLQQENALLKSELQELKNELNEIKAYLGFKTQN